MALTKTELVQLDKDLDAGIPYHLLNGMCWEEAVLTLFRYHATIAAGQQSEKVQFKALQDRFRDAAHIALSWISQCCNKAHVLPPQMQDQKVWNSIEELFDASLKYSAVLDTMNILWSDWQEVTRQGTSDFVLSYRSEKAMCREIGDFIVGVAEEFPSFDYEKYNRLFRKLSPHLEDDRLVYTLSNKTFSFAKREIVRPLQPPRDLDPAWSFGSYTVAQFDSFWESLLTFAFIHSTCYGRVAKEKGFPVNSAVPVLSKDEWLQHLSHWSRLEEKTVESIIADLTLDIQLLGTVGDKKSDASYQPFALLGGYLALNTRFVATSNAQRNMWDLLSILRPPVWGSLNENKESYWKNELTERLKRKGLQTYRITVGKGDIDLLVLDPNAHFALAIQMKFQVAVDRIKPHITNYVRKAQMQAKEGTDWIKMNLRDAAQQLGMSETELQQYQIEPLALMKNHLMTGYVPDDVPITNESLLFWIIDEPHRQNLRTLWRCAKAESHLPIVGVHFVEERKTLEFAGKRFIRSSLPQKEPWSPEKDIRIV
jgi:hypothetical protein